MKILFRLPEFRSGISSHSLIEVDKCGDSENEQSNSQDKGVTRLCLNGNRLCFTTTIRRGLALGWVPFRWCGRRGFC